MAIPEATVTETGPTLPAECVSSEGPTEESSKGARPLHESNPPATQFPRALAPRCLKSRCHRGRDSRRASSGYGKQPKLPDTCDVSSLQSCCASTSQSDSEAGRPGSMCRRGMFLWSTDSALRSFEHTTRPVSNVVSASHEAVHWDDAGGQLDGSNSPAHRMKLAGRRASARQNRDCRRRIK